MHPTVTYLPHAQHSLLLATEDASTSPPWQSEPLAAFEAWRRQANAANGYAYSERSVRQHLAMWSTFVAFCVQHEHSVLTVSVDGVGVFFAGMRGRPPKPGAAGTHEAEKCGVTQENPAAHSTRTRYAQLLNQTFLHLVKLRLRRDNPLAPHMSRLCKPEAPAMVSFLNSAQEQAYLDYVNSLTDTSWHGRRNQAVLLLLSASGITEGELVELRLGDIVLDDYSPVVQVRHRGLKHVHTAPIHDIGRAALTRWLTLPPSRGADAWLFPASPSASHAMLARDVYLITRAALEASGFQGKQRGPQTLRNTFIRRQLWHGIDALTINAWVGLQSDRTIDKIRRTLPGSQGQRPA